MNHRGKILAYVSLVIPIVIYYFLVFYYSVNIPKWDDYETVLSYINNSYEVRVDNLFAQSNEHRILFTRIVSECCYSIFGEINFVYLIYIGNAALVIIFLLLFKLYIKQKTPFLFFIPIPFLFFQAQSWGNMTWATASLQNYYILLFSLLTIYFWNKKTVLGYFTSIIFCIVSTYTSASGLLTFITLLIFEITHRVSNFRQHRLKNKLDMKDMYRILVLLLFTSCMIYLYLAGYKKPSHHPDIVKAILNPYRLILYISAFLGSHTGIMGKWFAAFIGMIQLGIFFVITFKRYDLKNPIVYYFLLFNFMSVFLIAVGRSGFGVKHALSSHYRILSCMVFILEYWAIVDMYSKAILNKRRLYTYIILLVLLLNAATSIKGMTMLAYQKKILIEGISEWKRSGKGLFYYNSECASHILQASIDKGIYVPPKIDHR